MKVTREFHIESAGIPHNSVGLKHFSTLHIVPIPLVDEKFALWGIHTAINIK